MGAAIGLMSARWIGCRSSRDWNVGFARARQSLPAADTVKDVFYNQAFNTFYNYGSRSFYGLKEATGLGIAAGFRFAGRSVRWSAGPRTKSVSIAIFRH